MSDTLKKPLTGKRVLVYLALFFGVVTVVNAIFITKALETHSGVVIDKPYERGLNYNQVLEKAEKQKNLGWTGVASFGSDGTFLYTVSDKLGKPVTEATVTLNFLRPAQAGHDFSLKLVEGKDGVYQSSVTAPLKGVWDVHISVVQGSDEYHDKTQLTIE